MATVLLVDDDAALLRLAAQVLQRAGHAVTCASNGVEALFLFESYADRIDVVLTDVDMPEMDGLELAERIRSTHPGAKLILMSGVPRPAPYPFLYKPFRIQGLRDAVAQAVSDTAT